MKIKKLFKNIKIPDLKIKGSQETKLTGISANSKTVAPGNLFLAKKGRTFDGSDFISEAVAAGAAAVVCDLYNPFLSQIVQIIHDNASSLEAKIASAYYDFPSQKLFMLGVTGTNGKTTVSYLLKHLLDNNKKSCGLLGTIEYIIGKNSYPATLTTPAACNLQRFLKEMVNAKMKVAVMEASSQAIDQGRCEEIDFDAVIFTNLSQDHLDYHGNLKEYVSTKAKLFENLSKEKTAIINLDDAYAQFIIGKTKAKIMTFAIDQAADVKAEEINCSAAGLKFTLVYQGQRETITSQMIGRFNVYNILATISAALVAGIKLKKIIREIATFRSVRGRLERVKILKPFSVFVDYAHSADALQKVLQTLKEFKTGRLITVFGCGGNRDSGKRPTMGRIGSELSDFCFITNDNPRKEEPQKIIKEIVSGIRKDKNNYLVEEDRFEAIKKALKMAKKDDIVLIAGKGHETYQIFQDQTSSFDDRGVVEEICQTF